MLDDFLKDRAARYASADMSAREREQFELVLEFHDELRDFTSGLNQIATEITLAALPRTALAPSPSLRARLSGSIVNHQQQTIPEGLVMSGPDRLVQWVNPAFSAMCGYSLDELRGRNLGPILQGEKTDRATVQRMRSAVHEHRPCRETVLNYHKNGTPYWVDISITPVLDDDGKLLWLVARESEIKEKIAA